jgi:hypothetical protein
LSRAFTGLVSFKVANMHPPDAFHQAKDDFKISAA